ncbi:fimbrial chaperone [Citrobacter rodentium]|uniref:Fimbrial chaperone protein n=2 Tax=Citrobacter rodentium TaxID=67825 RepID=D2TIR5_CITRI|nr:fimbrial chaperone [Citrobacter rodentium]KIQ50962.1 fimbrial chaperone protein [Citrobacter rodentium]QBY30422.1 fimbrial chaperone [Citrobacter rodentium]UHO32208.1 fimbrial chaperone [Citrobacter rodentium NBRC 105723 = DSM 16636]CBG90825.1 putative fimbrial chaperone protein [Citrobacter rodentium ICC168]HAT8012616.1 fimbrial chaperone protein [Citrobacter rodentium NBRC 105723 = DSM 16636]
MAKNNSLRKLFISASLFLFTATSHAAFVLNSTRYVFDEKRQNISVQVDNQSSQEYGGQIWIENQDQNDKNVYFVTSPTFFKVADQHKQILRILKINDALPKDKESLFWINIQEIPKAPKEGANTLSIALHTQVKMFYRPDALKEKRENAEQQIKMISSEGNTVLWNDTPYYFAIISVKQNGTLVKVSDDIKEKLSVFAPGEKISLGKSITGSNLSIVVFDDYGVDKEYKLNKS